MWVSGKPVEIEVGSLMPAELLASMATMESEKQNAYGNRLDLFNYYMRGSVASEPRDAVFDGMSGSMKIERLYCATDSQARATASRSIALFRSAILPLGVDSVSIRSDVIEAEIDKAMTEGAKNEGKEMLATLTKTVRDIISEPAIGFLETVANTVADIMNYGTCFAVWVHGAVRHIPFQDVFFLQPSSEKWQWYWWRHVTSGASLFEMYQYKTEMPKSQYEIKHLICPIQEVELGKIRYLHLTMLADESKILAMETFDPVDLPVFTCRLGTGNAIYTSGAGINTIGSVITMNYALNAMRLSGSLTINPHIVKTQFSTLEPEAMATGSSMNQSDQGLIAEPGKVTTVAIDQTLGATKPFEILSQPGPIIEVFNKVYADAATNVEAGFGADLFSTFGAEVTATEINERRSASMRVFNGLSVQYYANFLNPLIKKLALPALGKTPELFKVKIYNYSDIQREEIKAERLMRALQMKGAIAQMSQALPPEELASFNRQIDDMIKE